MNSKNYGAITDAALRKGDIEEIERLEAEKQDENVENLRYKRGDGFLNRELRSLNVAAYLRVIYALIEYAPTVALKLSAIRTVRTDFIFQGITMLCDATHWDEEAGIVSKYLRIMRYVIKTPVDREEEHEDMLMHYNWISHVIQKALARLVDKINKEIPLT